MLGAIVGDVVGSAYEFHNTKDYNFHLFTSKSTFTDDTVMTLAVARWLTIDLSRSKDSLVKCMRMLGIEYPDRGYGGRFMRWLFARKPKPYNSWGNGSSMRVSPVGLYASSLDEALSLAKTTAEVTHNHPEGVKGAQAIAAAIFLARQGKAKEEIRQYVTDTFGYDLSRTIDSIRPTYTFDESCMSSTPEAIIAFLDGHDFESTIRNAVSIGGDSDTIAAMAGGIAQVAYGIPKDMAGYCYECLTPELRKILDDFESMIGEHDDDPFNLERFVTMQDPMYGTILNEMREGHKQGHYMWYVFPQLRGLGRSANSYVFGLADVEEAATYLKHPILGKRLREVTSILVARDMDDISEVFDKDHEDNVDSLKFHSCMTLFDIASPNEVFKDALDKFYDGEHDARTVNALMMNN